MQFIRRLLFGIGGRGAGSAGGDRGLYFYVRPAGCTEIVRVRVDPLSHVSQDDDGSLFARKYVRGVKCTREAELVVFFGSDRRVSGTSVENGELLAAADWEAQQKS